MLHNPSVEKEKKSVNKNKKITKLNQKYSFRMCLFKILGMKLFKFYNETLSVINYLIRKIKFIIINFHRTTETTKKKTFLHQKVL